MVQTKVINHKEVEICNISKKPIDTLKDKYTILLECEGEKIVSIKFYKSNLLLDLIKGNGELIKKDWENKQKLMVGNILNKLPFGKEVFEIK